MARDFTEAHNLVFPFFARLSRKTAEMAEKGIKKAKRKTL